jgi:hypothetical protein
MYCLFSVVFLIVNTNMKNRVKLFDFVSYSEMICIASIDSLAVLLLFFCLAYMNDFCFLFI